MWYVYIIQSNINQSYYTGFTSDLRQRLRYHNLHRVKTTAANGLYSLVWYCALRSKKRALDFERYLKSSSGYAFRRKHLI